MGGWRVVLITPYKEGGVTAQRVKEAVESKVRGGFIGESFSYRTWNPGAEGVGKRRPKR